MSEYTLYLRVFLIISSRVCEVIDGLRLCNSVSVDYVHSRTHTSVTRDVHTPQVNLRSERCLGIGGGHTFASDCWWI